MLIKEFVVAQNTAADAGQWVNQKVRNEEGEVASWMILAAGLAAAAAGAITILKPWISQELPNKIKSGATN